ncbi:MAG: hypothetical protein KJZ65_06415 [Phycisphaerales bacterium]|nr:hypothetical protein [Phycisphaerales bacterium]
MPSCRTKLRPLAEALVAATLTGCASPRGGVSFTVPSDQYGATIDAAREAFLDARFIIDRVDARAGIIETQPKHSAGLATPWDTEQATLRQEWSDLLNQHERVARLIVEPIEGPTDDLAAAAGELQATVEVIVYRVRRSGWRVETETISRSTHSRDMLGPQRGQPNSYSQPVARDDQLAEALAQRIRERLALASAPADSPPVQPD